MSKVSERARRFLALDARVGDARIEQGAIVDEHVRDGGDPLELAVMVETDVDTLMEYRDVFLFCEGHGLVTGVSFEGHRLAIRAKKDRAWLAGFARGHGGRATVDSIREALGNRPATRDEIERAAHVFATRPPEQTAPVLSRVISENRGLARGVVSNPKAQRTLYEEEAKHTAEKVEQKYGTTPRPERVNPQDRQFDRYLNIEGRLMDARAALRQAVRDLRDYTPNDRETSRWQGIVHDILTLANGAEDCLSGNAEFDNALRDLLTQES